MAEVTRDNVRFLLGHEPVEVQGLDPTTTVLEWLRHDPRRRGTKEGCAEGDCGACTVVVGRPAEAGIRYAAVDACIQLLPMLDGCQLLTVEDVRGARGVLHPVQQALVDHHGSQCGFCTPGIVMSLWALWRSGRQPTDDLVDDVLAGNLCRCTGYRPIVDAALGMSDARDADDPIRARETETLARLRAWAQDPTPLAFEAAGRSFHAPRTIEALADLHLAHPEATILAGATDVGLWVTKQDRRPPMLLSTGAIPELAAIVDLGDALSIGAAVTYSAAAEAIADLYPEAGALLRRLGSVQVRNAGTIGGNVGNGSPIGDSPPFLIAAGATLVLRRGAERRTLPVEDYFLAYGRQDRRPGELIEAISVPKPRPGWRLTIHKISKRQDQDISAVCAAFALRVEHGRTVEARLAFGGMAGIPQRGRAAEAALLGRELDEAAVEAAALALASDFTPLTDWRASAGYRLLVAQNLVRKLAYEAAGESVRLAPARVADFGTVTAHV